MKSIFLTSLLVALALSTTVRATESKKADTTDNTAVTSPQAKAPVAGSSTVGVSVAVVEQLAYGWSLEKDALGKPVYNNQNEKIGSIDDVIVDPQKALSYVIIGTGGFIGMDKHDVAIPINQLKREGDRFVLPGATKDSLKRMAEFKYAPRGKKAE